MYTNDPRAGDMGMLEEGLGRGGRGWWGEKKGGWEDKARRAYNQIAKVGVWAGFDSIGGACLFVCAVASVVISYKTYIYQTNIH